MKLLFAYRKTANIPQPPEEMGYGGWDNGFVRGHMAGHYLSAASRMYAATGDTTFRDNVDALVVGLAECQKALGTGHLAAFPETVLDAGGNSYPECFDHPHVEAGPSLPHGEVFPYNTAETCNSHNMLKLTRYLFEREPQRDHAEYFERALYNHILSSVAPDTGRMTYFHPLHGDFKIYLPGTECCVGSGIENTGRYGEGIYFQHQDTLWVNLYIPSELNWREMGIVIRQDGNIPYEKTVRLTVAKAAAPVQATLKVRIPEWVAGSGTLVVNGKTGGSGIHQLKNESDALMIQPVAKWPGGNAGTFTIQLSN